MTTVKKTEQRLTSHGNGLQNWRQLQHQSRDGDTQTSTAATTTTNGHYHNNNVNLTTLCPGLQDCPDEPVPERENQSDFTEAKDSEWQWHQVDPMQVCTSSETDNHASTPPLSFLQAGSLMPFLSPNQQHQRTEGNLWSLLTYINTRP